MNDNYKQFFEEAYNYYKDKGPDCLCAAMNYWQDHKEKWESIVIKEANIDAISKIISERGEK